jgi:putative methanogenesis marker protein 2
MDLEEIVTTIRNYPGVTRKRVISDVICHFEIPEGSRVLEAFGEDAAVIEFGENALLLAADGIMEDLMNKNALWAGFCSVLVNVNDIAAMGGIPLAMVSIVSMKKGDVLTEVLKGINAGINKFGVPMVGGHTHPDCHYNALDVAILGHVKRNEVILSSTAVEGDDVIFAMDIAGEFTPNIPYSWDSTSSRSAEFVQRQIAVMNLLARKGLLTAAKDISNPGCLGTLGMLLETSRMGAAVEIERIPQPMEVDPLQWLKAYQGCGFVVTCNPENSSEVCNIFSSVKLASDVVGRITADKKLRICDSGKQAVLFDFKNDIITGCNP